MVILQGQDKTGKVTCALKWINRDVLANVETDHHHA